MEGSNYFSQGANIIFADNCKYEIDEKSCVNKLYGFCLGLFGVHKNSIRFGWTYNKETDGLFWDWGDKSKVVWLNPPYSSKLIKAFVKKLSEHNNGIAIVVNRTDNLLFQEIIFPKAKSMIFMRRRVKFINPDGESRSPMFGSCLIAFGDECDRRLRESGIEGKYVKLN